MIQRFIIVISCLFFSACSNVSLQLPDEVDWSYFNQTMFDKAIGGYQCEYQIQVADSSILIKSLCAEQCDMVNSNGLFIDTILYDSIPFKNHMEYLDGSKMHVWDKWEYMVNYSDKSRITRLKYISTPTERLKLLSRRRPKREHKIEYTIDDKDYSVRLPSENGSSVIYNICQYDKTRFLFSMNMRIGDIKYSPTHYYYYCVVMIDLEDLSRKRFLGLKL